MVCKIFQILLYKAFFNCKLFIFNLLLNQNICKNRHNNNKKVTKNAHVLKIYSRNLSDTYNNAIKFS